MSPLRIRSARGFVLAELMVTLVVLGLIGVALTRLTLTQARLFSVIGAQRSARSISRGALNLLTSDLRMVEDSGGVVAAAPDSLTVRVPYAMGVVCSAAGGGTKVSLLPTDSVMFANASPSGYAWRDANGIYQYMEANTAVTSSGANCLSDSIFTVGAGRTVVVSPALPVGATVGSQVFLFERVTYRIKASAAISGRLALWRRRVGAGVDEEIAAPFDATTRFAFYDRNSDTADSLPPATLSRVRGVDLILVGASEATPQGASVPAKASMTYAVFFRNKTTQ